MRYYIWLLRRNYVFANDLRIYKKYFIRIIKDILILEKEIDYKNMAELNNRQVVNLFLDKFQLELNIDEINLVSNIISLEYIKQLEIEKYLVFFSKQINEIVWKNF